MPGTCEVLLLRLARKAQKTAFRLRLESVMIVCALCLRYHPRSIKKNNIIRGKHGY